MEELKRANKQKALMDGSAVGDDESGFYDDFNDEDMVYNGVLEAEELEM